MVMRNIYWIGARNSDVIGEPLFTGSITRYGNDSKDNYAFCNNNFTKDYNEFINVTLHDILNTDNTALFWFGNELSAHKYGRDVYNHSICMNNLSVVESLNDKIFARNYLGQVVKTPGSVLLNTSICSDYTFIKSVFNNEYTQFVMQATKGAGGNDTYYMSENVIPEISTKSPYLLITPYISKALAVNLHIVLTKSDYRLLPPSVQITIDKFKYSGSDFIAYQYLDSEQKNRIINCANAIAMKMQNLGCIGLLGVDLLVTENDILFIECNYRYQGSSFLLNLGLCDNNLPSLFQCWYNAFNDDLNNIPYDIHRTKINYSSFRRTNWNRHIKVPNTNMIIAPNKSDFSSSDGYQQYEIYKQSIATMIAKQEEQDLYLFDSLQ